MYLNYFSFKYCEKKRLPLVMTTISCYMPFRLYFMKTIVHYELRYLAYDPVPRTACCRDRASSAVIGVATTFEKIMSWATPTCS
ncbi:hypothetical protein Y032_0006g3091 [Ancylostoma ceylanicum]|uniref:Uncharacterized protein n=1 Tax=Ancylostoma ceylanicum TaxID=53326 RepID=A0A016VPZ6_9BILA|nr:hypothetical protein Y032_0006g3091 [Ancylostoma ceylanicum]